MGEFERHAEVGGAGGRCVGLAVEVGKDEIELCAEEVYLALHAGVVGKVAVGGVRHILEFVEEDVCHIDAVIEVIPCAVVGIIGVALKVIAHILLPRIIAEHGIDDIGVGVITAEFLGGVDADGVDVVIEKIEESASAIVHAICHLRALHVGFAEEHLFDVGHALGHHHVLRVFAEEIAATAEQCRDEEQGEDIMSFHCVLGWVL